jgi:hypothetical protein
MANSATALRRWLGTFSLAVAFAMLIWGQTLLKPYLQGHFFLPYWLLFLIFTCCSVGISLLDFFAVRRAVKEDIAELKARALTGIERGGRGLKKGLHPSKKPILQEFVKCHPPRNDAQIPPQDSSH